MNKRIRSILSILCVIFTLSISIPVKAENNINNYELTLEEITYFLDNCENTQEIIVTEKEAMQILCQTEEGRNTLKQDLKILSNKSQKELKKIGMNDNEINILKDDFGDDDLDSFINTYSSDTYLILDLD